MKPLNVSLTEDEIRMIAMLKTDEDKIKVGSALLAQKIIVAKLEADLDEILRLKDEMVKMGVK